MYQKKIALLEYVERIEQFKNTGYNGKCMWTPLILLPALSLHSPSLFQQSRSGEWQELLYAHNKMHLTAEVGPALSPSQLPWVWPGLLYIPWDPQVTTWCYVASDVYRKMTDILSKGTKSMESSVSQATTFRKNT